MVDTFWDGVGRDLAHELEPLFYVNQTNVMEAAVKILVLEAQKTGKTVMPARAVLSELHRSATLFLLTDAGAYRKINVSVYQANGSVIHQPPPHEEVEHYMSAFFKELEEIWDNADPLTIAGFILWRVNWIHPFQNGNGRSARAFSYLCLCIKLGFWLPGDQTIIDMITANRQPYQEKLHAIDLSLENGKLDLSPMTEYLGGLLLIQLGPFLQPAIADDGTPHEAEEGGPEKLPT